MHATNERNYTFLVGNPAVGITIDYLVYIQPTTIQCEKYCMMSEIEQKITHFSQNLNKILVTIVLVFRMI